MDYEFAYRIGFHPLRGADDQPPFVEKISEPFDREESGRDPRYEPAELGANHRA